MPVGTRKQSLNCPHQRKWIDVDSAAIAARIEAEHPVSQTSIAFTRHERFLKGSELESSDDFTTRTLAAEVEAVLVVEYTPNTVDNARPTVL